MIYLILLSQLQNLNQGWQKWPRRATDPPLPALTTGNELGARRRADLANPALATMRTATCGVRVAGDRGRASSGSAGGSGSGAGGFLVGEEARSLFAGELTFPEQCRQQGMCYVELGSGDDDSDADMPAFVDDEAEEGGAQEATHNTYCEICGAGGCIVPCDFCNLSFHGACLQPELVLPPGGDDFACPACVADKRAGGGDGVSALVLPAPGDDAAAAAAARHDRDEAVRREHHAICAFVRDDAAAAVTRSPSRAGAGEAAAAATRAVRGAAARGAAAATAGRAAAGGTPRTPRAPKKRRTAGRKGGRRVGEGDTDGSAHRENTSARDARQRKAAHMAASRAAAAASAPRPPPPDAAPGWSAAQLEALGHAVAAVSGGNGGLGGRHAVRRGADGRLHRAMLVSPASGGYAADFGEGEELLTLEDALRCCESLPGDGGWPIDWQAVAAHAARDATLGLREKGVVALRLRWQRVASGDGGRAVLRVMLCRLPPSAAQAGAAPHRSNNTPDDLLCSLYDASTSAFSLKSARLRTLPHIPCAAQDIDLGEPGVGSDVVYLAGHSTACCGHDAAGSGSSAVFMRGTLVSWPHDCGCAAVLPEGGGAAVAAHRVYSDCGIGTDVAVAVYNAAERADSAAVRAESAVPPSATAAVVAPVGSGSASFEACGDRTVRMSTGCVRRAAGGWACAAGCLHDAAVAGVRDDIRRYGTVTPRDVARMVGGFMAAETEHDALRVCAACGVRDPRLKYHHEGAITELAANHWMRAPLQFVRRLAAVQFDLYVREGDGFRTVVATRLDLHHVCCASAGDDGGVTMESGAAAAACGGNWFHAVRAAIQADGTFYTCPCCHSKMDVGVPAAQGQRPASDEASEGDAVVCFSGGSYVAGTLDRWQDTRAVITTAAGESIVSASCVFPKHDFSDCYSATAPPGSIAAGDDLGRVSGLADLGVATDTSTLERLVVATARPYCVVVKVVGRTARTKLVGHTITFPQRAERGDENATMAARVAAAVGCVSILLVGDSGQRTVLEQKALHMPDMRLRPDVVLNAFAVAHHLHGAPPPPTPEEVLEHATERVARDIVAAARLLPPDVEPAPPSDVAHVRSSSRTAARAGAEGDCGDDAPAAHAGVLQGSVPDMPAVLSSLQRAVCDRGETPVTQRIGRAAEAIDDYASGAEALYDAWPTLLPLRSGLPSGRAVSVTTSTRVCTQYDGRFGNDPTLLFCLADTHQRHARNAAVQANVRSSPEAFAAFEEAVNDPDLPKMFEDAQANPTGAEARAVLARVSSFLSVAGSRVMWTNEQRKACLPALLARDRKNGAGSQFYTYQADDVRGLLPMRLSHAHTSTESFPAVMPACASAAMQAPVGEGRRCEAVDCREHVLQERAAHHPVATGLAFCCMRDRVRTHLIGGTGKLRRTSVAERPCGAFGVPGGSSEVVETNGRKNFHAHGTFHGGVPPQVMADCAAVPALAAACARATSSQLSGELPLAYHLVEAAMTALHVGPPRVAAHSVEPPPSDDASDDEVQQWFEHECKPFAHVVAMRDHVHSHCGSCVHGASGKVGCRFGSPWAHGVDGCRIVQLRRGERTRGDVCAWCAMCTPDDGSGAQHAAEAKRRGLQCTPSTTISDAPPHGCPDERALAVELSRKLLGTVSPLPPSIGGVTAHIHGALEARAAGREVCSVVPVADDLVLLELQRLFQGTLLVVSAGGVVCNTERLPAAIGGGGECARVRDKHAAQAGDAAALAGDLCACVAAAVAGRGCGAELLQVPFTTSAGNTACVHVAVLRVRACGERDVLVRAPCTHAMRRALAHRHGMLRHAEHALAAVASEGHVISDTSGPCDDGEGAWSGSWGRTIAVDNVDMASARRLLEAWTSPDLACRNGVIANYSHAFAACCKANCVSQPLGAGDAAKVLSLYSLKYEVKNLNDILLSAAVFVAAARDIREHPSTSEDTGSGRRNAMHFAQRSLNLGGKELCSTVAAAIVIGADPGAASDDVTYVQARDFVRVAVAAEAAGANGLPFGFGAAGSGSDSDGDDDGCRAARDFAAGLGGGACYSRVFRARGGKVPVSQAHHYAYRDPRIWNTTAHEFMQLYDVVELDESSAAELAWFRNETEALHGHEGVAAAVAGAAAAARAENRSGPPRIGLAVVEAFHTPGAACVTVPIEGLALGEGDADRVSAAGYVSQNGCRDTATTVLHYFHEGAESRARVAAALDAVAAGSGFEATSATCRLDDERPGAVTRVDVTVTRAPRGTAAVAIRPTSCNVAAPSDAGCKHATATVGCVVGRRGGGWLVRYQNGYECACSDAELQLLREQSDSKLRRAARGAGAQAFSHVVGGAALPSGSGGGLDGCTVYAHSQNGGAAALGRLQGDGAGRYRVVFGAAAQTASMSETAAAHALLSSARLAATAGGGDGNVGGAGRGRPRRRRLLVAPHPLASTHVLSVRCASSTPLLAGKPPPPALGGGATGAQQLEFARYYLSLFKPWSARDPPQLSVGAWQAWARQLEHESCARRALPNSLDAAATAARVVAHGRSCAWRHTAAGFTAVRRVSDDANRYRMRHRDEWRNTAKPVARGGSAPVAASQEAIEALQVREAARRRASQRPLATRLRAAARLSEWLGKMAHGPIWGAVHAGRAAAMQAQWPAAAGPPAVAPSLADVQAALAVNKTVLTAGVESSGGARAGTPGDGQGGGAGGVVDYSNDDEVGEMTVEQWTAAIAQWRAEEGTPPPLEPFQRKAARVVLEATVNRKRTGADAGCTLLVGAAGTGKSEVVKALRRKVQEAGCGRLVVTAYTGIASATFLGSTLLRLFNLGSNRGSSLPGSIRLLGEQDLQKLRERFKAECGTDFDDVGGIVIDEVSFCSAKVLGFVESRMRQLARDERPWGNVPVVLAGDPAFQRSPPGGKSWSDQLVEVAMQERGWTDANPNSAEGAGLAALRSARRIEFTYNMRARKDKSFADDLRDSRNTASTRPFKWRLVNIKKRSLSDPPEFEFAPIGCLQNAECLHFNQVQMERFARAFNTPLVRWRCELAGASKREISGKDAEDLFEDEEEGLWQYFVKGMPYLLKENIQPTRGIVNGSQALAHSLVVGDGTQLVLGEAFEIVTLSEPPYAVNVRVGDKPGGVHRWHGECLPDLGDVVNSVVQGEQVIPITVAPVADEVDTNGLVAATRNLPEKTLVKKFPLQVAFAMTDYGLQGRTLSYLVINLCVRGSYKMNSEAFYVLVSRCRTRSGLRCLDGDDKDNVKVLQHTLKTHAWVRAYNAHGVFEDARAVSAMRGDNRGKKGASKKRGRK